MIKKRLLTTSLIAGLSMSSQAVLVAQYDFSDGVITNDTSGNGHSLTLEGTGNVTTNANGYSVDTASDSFMKVLNIADTTAFTVSLWFKPAVNPPNYAAMVSTDHASKNWQLDGHGGGYKLRFNTQDGKNVPDRILALDTWNHIVVSTDGVNSSVYASEHGGALDKIINNIAYVCGLRDLRLGANRDEMAKWAGGYANVKVYDTALSETEIEALFYEGADGLGTPPPPPVPPSTTNVVWEADMSVDPVGDGWVVRGAANDYSVSSGLLSMNPGEWGTLLDTEPVDDFWKGLTKVEMAWRATSEGVGAGGLGAGIWLNTDTDAPSYGAIHFDANLSDGAQSVTIFEGFNNPILTLEGFSTNMLTLTADIVAHQDKVIYEVTDGVITQSGEIAYQPLPANGANDGLGTLFTSGPSAEFDYVRLEINAMPDETYAYVDTDDIALALNIPATDVQDTVQFVYGSSNDVHVSASISDESHLGSFSVLTATPVTLGPAGTGILELDVQYDNTVSNLNAGSVATGLVTVSWSEVGSGVTNDIAVPIRVNIAQVAIWGAASGDFHVGGSWQGGVAPVSGLSSVLFDSTGSGGVWLKTEYTIASNQFMRATRDITLRAAAGAELTIESGGELDFGQGIFAQQGDDAAVTVKIEPDATVEAKQYYPQVNWDNHFIASDEGVTTFEVKQGLYLKGNLIVDLTDYAAVNGDLVLFDYGSLGGFGVFTNVSVIGGEPGVTYEVDYDYSIDGGGDLGIALIIPSPLASNGTPYTWLEDHGIVERGGDYAAAEILDSDSDGLLNWEEYHAGTVPTNEASVLAVNRVIPVGVDQYEVSWQSVTGKTYNVLYEDDLMFPTTHTGATDVAGVESETVSTVTVSSATAFFTVELAD